MPTAPLRGAGAVRVFACFALGYVLSYALRAINAVIAPALVAEMGLSNADLGMLSSAYFISFGAMQLPLGVWLDKYGSRRVESALLLVAALGAALFAASTSLTGLWIGRALIGVGVSACLMAAFKAYRQWFAFAQQSQLASWMLVAGTSGALSATVPVNLALPLVGWRGVFWIMAMLLVMVSAAIFFSLRSVERRFREQALADAQASAGDAAGKAARTAANNGDASPAKAPAPDDGGYRRIFGTPYFWRLAVLGLVNHGIFSALQTLWAGPWMTTVLGKTPAQAGQILFALNLVLMLGFLALGWALPRLLARGWNVHRMIGIGMAGMLLSQAAMLFAGGPQAWLLWLLLAAFVPVVSLVQSHAGLAFPAALAGRANSAYNMHLFIGAFGAQWGFGLLVDAFKSTGLLPADAFRATLVIAVLLQAASLAFFAFSRAQPDPH